MGLFEEGMRSLAPVMLAGLFAYGAFIVLVFWFQTGLLFFPMRALDADPKDAGMAYEEVRLKTADGVTLSGWFVPAKEPRGVLLFCHGNAGNISHRLDSVKIFHELGLSVLIFDYRGFGQSEGSISEEGSYLDAEAAWEHLVAQRGVEPSEIILFGRSIGGSVAAHLATKQPAAALIVESTFSSITQLGSQLYPFVPVRLISRYRYETAEYLSRVHMPLLIIHSRDDEIIPFSHALALYRAANEPKELLEIMGDHNAGFFISGVRYSGGIERFISDRLSLR